MARQDRDRRKRLNRMMKDLQNVPPCEILPYLTCLSQTRVEQVRARERSEGPTIAAAELFEELPKREDWYSDLLNALREIERDTLADRLEGPERQSPSSGSSQSGASGMSFQNTHVQSRQQCLPANPVSYPQPQGNLGRQPEPEASFTPGHPIKPEEKDVQCKGEQEVRKPNFDEVPEQRPPPPPAELPMPIPERMPEAPAPDLQSRTAHRGSPEASSPIYDQERHDDSESDTSNASPPQEGHSSRVKKGVMGEAEKSVAKMLPSNPSPGKDDGLDGVSVHPSGEGLAGNKAVPGRVKEEGETWREEERKRREGKKDEEEWNIHNTTDQIKHLNISKPNNIPVKLNNLSPTKASEEFKWKCDETQHLQSPNVEVREDDPVPHSLSSNGIDPRINQALDSLTDSQVLVSDSLTASSQNGSCLQQNKGNKESLVGALKGASKDGGRGDRDAIGVVEGGAAESNGEVQGDGEVPHMVDASNDNQDSLIMRMGTVVRGYLPTVLNSVSDHLLKP